ncbi:MAG: hypothetical protein DRP47_11565 [Candidatus Zixiibacteriota bacterium]|nr:MAG: hypothetical protein DRP47_11565 [candidate division Zixibacteria bacterium]
MLAAQEDPRRFLAQYQDSGVIIDEAQRTPKLFSYLQEIVCESRKKGRYLYIHEIVYTFASGST